MQSDAAHARLSPSAAEKWMGCPGSLAMEESFPDSTSQSADEGTAAHQLAAWTLESEHKQTFAYEGRVLDILNGEYWPGGAAPVPAVLKGQTKGICHTFVADEEMCRHVQTYVDSLLEYAEGHTLVVEQRVNFSHYVGVENSFGTSDGIIVTSDGDEIQVHDLKYGANPKNRVDAQKNKQLMLYALGAYYDYGMVGDFKRVRMVIHQPRLDHISEWDCTIEELLEFGGKAYEAAMLAAYPPYRVSEDGSMPPRLATEALILSPSDKACQWCKAKAACPALTKKVADATLTDFDDLVSPLETPADVLNMVEGWAKAKLADIERRLLAGESSSQWKLVEGKKGNRAWTSKQEAEATLKAMRLKIEEMYDLSVISPTSAEKLLAKDHPKRWKKLQDLITRSDGRPSVAPVSDKRSRLELKPTIDDFADIGGPLA